VSSTGVMVAGVRPIDDIVRQRRRRVSLCAPV